MSHIPLLSKHALPPRLQSPRRAPQVCCLCLLVGTVLLVAYSPLLYAPLYNATHAGETAVPPELHRLLETPSGVGLSGIQAADGTYLNDLLVTVQYLAKRALKSR